MTPRSVGVHDGIFHADEVTACALLILFDLVDKEHIIRTRDPKVLDACEYVCDVGGLYDPKTKRFDHHQVSYKGPLSSAGMVIHYLVDQSIIPDEEYEFLYKNLIKGIDDHDNGKSPQVKGHALFSHVIANFNPVGYDASSQLLNEAFHNALDFTYGHLSRMLERFRYNKECRKVVAMAMEEAGQVLYFDRAVPWVESFFALDGKHHPAKFVVMPSGEHWKLRGIPPDDEHRMDVRVPLPQEWAGLLGDDLEKVSGIKGAVFCHKGRFTSVWESREAALAALEKVMKKNGLYEDTISKNH
jgi:uncharacterized UPF0160 family protein